MPSKVCPMCRLTMPETSTAHGHAGSLECIEALQRALRRQRELAQTMAFDISTRFLATLEQLSLEPDVGIAYFVPGGSDGKQSIVHTQVAGMFATIWRKYQALCDWSPLQEQKDKVAMLKAHIREYGTMMARVHAEADGLSMDTLQELADAIHQADALVNNPASPVFTP